MSESTKDFLARMKKQREDVPAPEYNKYQVDQIFKQWQIACKWDYYSNYMITAQLIGRFQAMSISINKHEQVAHRIFMKALHDIMKEHKPKPPTDGEVQTSPDKAV